MPALDSMKERIKRSPVWKARIHRLMFCNARPRWWIRHLLNPFVFRHGKNAVIRRQTVMNVSPVNRFKLGAYSTIEEYTVVDNGVGDVIIGDHTRIGLRDTIIGPVQIGNHVILAQNVVISGLNHSYQDVSTPIHLQKVTTRTIVIEDESWVATNSIITAGVTIGRHAVVAAGCVVTKDVPPYTVVAGNPAKVIKRYDSEKQLWVREDTQTESTNYPI